MNRINFKIGFGYAFIHFSMEVLCFFFLYRVFSGGSRWWSIALIYDAIAFAGQVPVGSFCEKHPRFKPGVCGAVLLTVGAAVGLAAAESVIEVGTLAGLSTGGTVTDSSWFSRLLVDTIGPDTAGSFAAVAAFSGFVILSIGNALLHISGALVTLRASCGRLSETGIFVGGGAFGVITGRLLGSGTGPVWIPFVLMAAAFVVIIIIDRYMQNTAFRHTGDSLGDPLKKSDTGKNNKLAGYAPSFQDFPCEHNVAADRPIEFIIIVLAAVVAIRSYIGNGIPMQWKQTVFETIMLYVAMGAGKMAGGVLADLFGTRRVGVISCIAAVPFLLLGNSIMWVSLIGIFLFSMTMSIALGGIVSVLKTSPGVAFGITTFALFMGSLPIFFAPMPKGIIMNILLALLSLLSAGGIYLTTKNS